MAGTALALGGVIMSSKTDKIISMIALRQERHNDFTCHCYNNRMASLCKTPRFTVDEETHTVWCDWCGNRVEAFDAVMALTNYSDRVVKTLQDAHEEALRVFKLARNYKPWRRAMKNMESSIRQGMLPRCPHCDEPFRLEEIEYYHNERFYKGVQK